MPDSKIIAVVAHDAGGAELLSSMVVSERGRHTWSIVVAADSPAAAIFDRKGLSDLIVKSQASENMVTLWEEQCPDLLFCGTSSSKIELPHIHEARRRSVASVSFLDHWINQRERFDYPAASWKNNLPDFVTVSDTHAYQLSREFGVFNLLKIRNYYIADLLASYGESTVAHSGGTLLFISQAIREHCEVAYGDPRHFGYTQTDIAREVLESFPHLSSILGVTRLVVRLHPAEDAREYHSLFERYPGVEIICEEPSSRVLSANVSDADVVLGIDSMALLIAHLLGKPVISYMPPGRKCHLPLPRECKLHSLQNINGLDSIPLWGKHDGLSFYPDHDLSSMLSAMKKQWHEGCHVN